MPRVYDPAMANEFAIIKSKAHFAHTHSLSHTCNCKTNVCNCGMRRINFYDSFHEISSIRCQFAGDTIAKRDVEMRGNGRYECIKIGAFESLRCELAA